MADNQNNRRRFLRQLGGTALLFSSGSLEHLAAREKFEERTLQYERRYSANDKIRLAVIGAGIMGHNDVDTALKVPGTELVAACDLYTGRLEHMKELHGRDLFTTRDYREILRRKDIDAVIIATSDHYHARITKDALGAGKHVYCEKPMVHQLKEGHGVVDSWKSSGRAMQVGSQRVSSLTHSKARELYLAGDIGQLNCIEASNDRQSALGAWEYTMPTDGDPQTVDWDKYIAGMPRSPWDAKKFFWWRNYKDFGTGMAGDLYVHLLSGVHYITGSLGPTRIMASGQLAYWKDGRDVPDVMTAILDYPETAVHPAFQLTLRVNFVSGAGERSSTRFIGSEGVMEVGGNSITVNHSLMSKAPGIGGWDSLGTYPEEMQKTLKEQYNQKYSAEEQKRPSRPPIRFVEPRDFDEHQEHFANFFEAVRNNKPTIEDPVFGFRAAAPCLACNDSYFGKKIIHWDPEKMELG